MSEGTSVSIKVSDEVADREGTDPTELQPPLHTVVDTEALDDLFRQTPSTPGTIGTVEFQYRGYKIQVDSSGEVQIGETISFTERTEPRTQPVEDMIGD
ncbi:HalOD1 output domain-containing protein [Halomontanus rarus]|uniref:HalOD1 output domain-containing protein n=1 Tax=Halomontanus rarus TaxID=3034020 RepID=UPI0023E79C4C|nr:HalOD1 output domain-containing protein [Halovivax sp. TS33]